MREKNRKRDCGKRPQPGKTCTGGDISGYSRVMNSSVWLEVRACVGETKFEPDYGRSRMPG